jgi:hypothetical protein
MRIKFKSREKGCFQTNRLEISNESGDRVVKFTMPRKYNHQE